MLRIAVEIDWVLLGLVAALGAVLAGLYAAALSTEKGRILCRRRTHWTVIGGHLLMALTMCMISPEMAGLWLLWSLVHGLPLVIRSEVLRWRDEKQREAAVLAAVRGALRGVYEAGDDRGGGDRYGDSGAGVAGSG